MSNMFCKTVPGSSLRFRTKASQPGYMLALLSPSQTPEEFFSTRSFKSVGEAVKAERNYDLTSEDFDELKVCHRGKFPPRCDSWVIRKPARYQDARRKAWDLAAEADADAEAEADTEADLASAGDGSEKAVPPMAHHLPNFSFLTTVLEGEKTSTGPAPTTQLELQSKSKLRKVNDITLVQRKVHLFIKEKFAMSVRVVSILCCKHPLFSSTLLSFFFFFSYLFLDLMRRKIVQVRSPRNLPLLSY